MSKFKNKKALALSVGAIMAGVSVIGIVAACAPTKAKPAKPTEKKVEQPQTSGNESSNPGSGSTTAGTKQGSENNTPSTPTDKGSNNGGTTNPSGGSTNTSPENPQVSNPNSSEKQKDEKMQDNQPGTGQSGGKTGKNVNPGTNGKENGGSTSETTKPVVSVANDAKLIKEESKYSLTLSVTNADNKYLEVELTEVSTNQENATKVNAKAKVESNSVKVSFAGLKAGTKYKVSMLKLYDSETATDGVNLELSSTLSGKEFETEAEQTPKVDAPTPTPQEPVSIALDNNAMLVKNNNKYELSLNITNANDKYLEIELTKVSDNSETSTPSKISNKAKVQDGKVVVSFDGLEDGAKYKIIDAQLYYNQDTDTSDNISLSQDLSSKELATEVVKEVAKPQFDKNKMIIENFSYDIAGDKKYYLSLTLRASKELFTQIEKKHFKLEIKNGNLYTNDNTRGSGLPLQKIKEENDTVLFKIFPAYPWNKANITINMIWEEGKTEKDNLLAKPFEIKVN